MELFEKIIDEISDKQPYAFLHYYGIGEPFLDEGLFKKLEYSKSKNMSNSVLFSNGQKLLEDYNYKRLVDSGVSIIGIDLDGFSQEIYGRVRIGGNFSLVKEGIEKTYSYIRKTGSNVRVEIAYQIYPGLNESDMNSFVEWCDANGYEYKLVTMHNWAGLRNDVPTTKLEGLADQHHSYKRQCPCCALWGGFMIAWDGKAGLCFQDADIKECLGDLNNDSISGVWVEKHLKKRIEHVKGVFKGLCENCDSYTSVNLPGFGSSLYPKTLRQ